MKPEEEKVNIDAIHALVAHIDATRGPGAVLVVMPISPHISLHLPTSPYISLHLPTSPYISRTWNMLSLLLELEAVDLLQ